MPKTPRHRDYAKEYADRLTRERERASREGRPFSRARARGHGNPDDNTRRRVRNLWKQNKAQYGSNYPGWNAVIASAQNYSWSEVKEVLRRQRENTVAYRSFGNAIPGRSSYDIGKTTVYPIEFFWYHGSI